MMGSILLLFLHVIILIFSIFWGMCVSLVILRSLRLEKGFK